MQPEVMPLGVRVADAGAADPFDPFEEGGVGANGAAQGGPVVPPASRDHVVDRRKRVPLVVEVAVLHGDS